LIPSYTVRKEDDKKASGKCSFIYCRGIGPLSGYEIKTFSHKGVGETIFSPLMRKIPHILSWERLKVKVEMNFSHILSAERPKKGYPSEKRSPMLNMEDVEHVQIAQKRFSEKVA
jgi:hypothetical protein